MRHTQDGPHPDPLPCGRGEPRTCRVSPSPARGRGSRGVRALVRIEEVSARAFGPFVGETLRLAPGMTVIWGPNEAGKSSWHAALYFGLCGRRRGQGQASREERDLRARHEPWDGGRWEVGATIGLEDGRRVELRHDLRGLVNCTAIDLGLGGRDCSDEIVVGNGRPGRRALARAGPADVPGRRLRAPGRPAGRAPERPADPGSPPARGLDRRRRRDGRDGAGADRPVPPRPGRGGPPRGRRAAAPGDGRRGARAGGVPGRRDRARGVRRPEGAPRGAGRGRGVGARGALPYRGRPVEGRGVAAGPRAPGEGRRGASAGRADVDAAGLAQAAAGGDGPLDARGRPGRDRGRSAGAARGRGPAAHQLRAGDPRHRPARREGDRRRAGRAERGRDRHRLGPRAPDPGGPRGADGRAARLRGGGALGGRGAGAA